MEIDCTVQIWRERNHYSSHATPLGVARAGISPQVPRFALKEAILLFLDKAEELGTLNEVLEEAGSELQDAHGRAPERICFEHLSAMVAP